VGVLGGGPAITQLDVRGAAVPVHQGLLVGRVDTVEPSPQVLELKPLAGKAWSAYRWLEIDSPAPGLAADTWTLSDIRPAPAQRQIAFETLGAGSRALRVYVGSCAQWHGYGAAPLYLSTNHSTASLSVKLLS
jgi:hypothetical protein